MNKMLCENIDGYCRAKDIKIAEFERLCGLSNGAVGKWRKGARVSLEVLDRIPANTGIPLSKWLEKKML